MVERGLGRCAGRVDAGAGQELQDDDTVGRRNQPVKVSLPDVV